METLMNKNIDEGRMGRLIDAAKNSEERKEDSLHIKPVDLGLSVLWGDKQLTYNDQHHFELNDLPELNGWRFPTRDEIQELVDNCDFAKSGLEATVLSKKNGKQITLNNTGYISGLKRFRQRYENGISFEENAYILSSEYVGEGMRLCVYGLKFVISSETLSFDDTVRLNIGVENLWPITLVKDKRVDEGRMGRLIDAARDNTVRKEDDINAKPVDMGLSVFWGSEYYNKNGQTYFSNEDLSDIQSNVWRLPTKAEIDELYSNCDIELDAHERYTHIYCVSKKNGNKILLNVYGFQAGSNRNFPKNQYILSNTECSFDEGDTGYYGIIITPFNKKKKEKAKLGMNNVCYPLMLVKDKRVNEGRMGKLIDAARNDEIRKEDEFIKDYIDFGDDVPVYWSKEPYTDEAGNDMFSYDEMCNFEVDGWRLPTYDEYMQIDFEKNAKDIRSLYYNQNMYVTFKVNDKEFRFRDVPNAIWVRFLLNTKSDKYKSMIKAARFNRERERFVSTYETYHNALSQAFLVKDKNKKQ